MFGGSLLSRDGVLQPAVHGGVHPHPPRMWGQPPVCRRKDLKQNWPEGKGRVYKHVYKQTNKQNCIVTVIIRLVQR